MPWKPSLSTVVAHLQLAFVVHRAWIVHFWADAVCSASARADVGNAGKWSVVIESSLLTCINQTDEHSFSYLSQQG